MVELTFVTDVGQTFVVEVNPNTELKDVMALVEAKSGIPVSEQSITHDGRELTNSQATIQQLGVKGPNAMLLLRPKIPNEEGRAIDNDAEMMRLQLLGDPDMMDQLEREDPEFANAAKSDPAKFANFIRNIRERQYQATIERQREITTLNADPFDIEAQRKIEEAIRQEAVLENLEHALEHAPESFGRVTMLYVPVEVNSHPVRAFVESGAQQTIMNPECAEACGIMRLLDKRFSGIARGVGTAKILGRVHSVPLKLSDLVLPSCSITVMEMNHDRVDLLLGLDILKAQRACIDLDMNVLRIKGHEIRFLPENELPDEVKSSRSTPVNEECRL